MRKLYFLALSFMCAVTGMANAQGASYRMETPETIDRLEACKVASRAEFPVAEAAASDNGTNKDGIIVSPAGERKVYMRSGGKHYLFGGMLPIEENYEDRLGEVVWGEDGTVYFKNIVSEFLVGSYVKGTLENGVVTVELPQLIGIAREDGEKQPYYVDRVVKQMINSYEATFVPDEKRTVTFILNSDGSLDMERSEGEWMIGVMNKNDVWMGYGDYNCSYTEYEEDFVVAPQGLVTEKYLLAADGSSHFVNVGFDNNDVYFQGMFVKFPDRWVKGTIDADNKITIANNQYLGFLDEFGVFTYFRNGRRYMTDEGYMTETVTDTDAVLTFDPEKRIFTSEDDAVFFANCALDHLYYTEKWRHPFLHIQPESYDMTPMDLWFVAWSPWDEVDHWCGIQFVLPAITVDSYSLDPDKVFWRMYINDDLYLFDYDEYPQFDDLTEWVPYNTDGLEIKNYGESLHTVILFVEETETVAVQSVYRADDGKNYYSNKMVYDVKTGETTVGVDEVGAAAEVESVTYYGLDGVKVSAPGAGIYVKQVRLTDGRVSTCKVVKK